MRYALLIAAAVATTTPLAAEAAPDQVHGEKAKATKASVTALKVKLEKARDAMRALAKQPAPSGLSNAQKKTYAAELAKLAAFADGTDVVVKELDAKLKETSPKLDSMSEMGEMESLRLQNALDKLAKALTTLSNVLKKQSDTASDILKNLK